MRVAIVKDGVVVNVEEWASLRAARQRHNATGADCMPVPDVSPAEPGLPAIVAQRWAGSNRARRIRFTRADWPGGFADHAHPDNDD